MLQDIAEVGEGALEFPAVDGLRSLAGVLEGYTKVAAASAGGLCAVDAGCSVANLPELIRCSQEGERARLSVVAAGWTYHVVVWCCCG